MLVGRPGRLSSGEAAGDTCRCRPRCRRCWRRASTGCRRRRSACSRPPRSSARRCPCRCCRPSPSVPEEALHRGLAHLQAAEFLYETSLFPERAYTFKHALTHEVAYGSLLQERRRALHARIVEALEALMPTGWPSRSNAWRTMPCGARCGTRPSPTAGRPAPGPTTAPRSARRWPPSSRPSRPSRTCPSTATPGCWPSSSASLWNAR